MMIAAEQTTAGIHITSGWIILRNGARFEEQLYLTERAAKTMARCFPGTTHRARRAVVIGAFR